MNNPKKKPLVAVLTILMAASTVMVAWMKRDQVTPEFMKATTDTLRTDVNQVVNTQLNVFMEELRQEGRSFVDNEFTYLLEDLARLKEDVQLLKSQAPGDRNLTELDEQIETLTNWTKDQKIKSDVRRKTDIIKDKMNRTYGDF